MDSTSEGNKTQGTLLTVELAPIVVVATPERSWGEAFDDAMFAANIYLECFNARLAERASQVNDALGGKPGEALEWVGDQISVGDIPLAQDLSAWADQKYEEGAAAAGGNRAVLFFFAIAKASKDIVLPTNVIDVIPGVKGAKAAGAAASSVPIASKIDNAVPAGTSPSIAGQVENAATNPPGGTLSEAAAKEASAAKGANNATGAAHDQTTPKSSEEPPPPKDDAGVAVEGKAAVWNLKSATERGRVIQDDLAKTEYKDWLQTDDLPGFQNARNFKGIDFVSGNQIADLKTTYIGPNSWYGTTRGNIWKLANYNPPANLVSGNVVKIFDLRVQPGGLALGGQKIQDLFQFANDNGIVLRIAEYP